MPAAEALLEAGAYTVSGDRVHGMVYAPFADLLAKRWGMRAEVAPELGLEELVQEVSSGRAVVASVHPHIRHATAESSPHPPRRGGHLVTVWEAPNGQLLFTNPSGLSGRSQIALLPEEIFDLYYARRGIVVDVDHVKARGNAPTRGRGVPSDRRRDE